jgi:hypothetical protein
MKKIIVMLVMMCSLLAISVKAETATTTEEVATTTPEVVKVTGCTSSCGGISGGQFMQIANPQMWIMTQIHFLEDKIEHLQAELNKMLGK